jgi:hypothetical protein
MFCPHCGKEVADDQAFCQYCGLRLGEPETQYASHRSATPWEDRKTVGFFKGLFDTLKDALTNPSGFFRKMPVKGGLSDPLLYALIVGMTGLILFYFWDILLRDSMQNFMSPELRAASERSPFGGKAGIASAVLTPFFLVFWLFIISGILHLFLLMVRGAQAGFEATFRVVSYSYSPYLFLAVPFCGMLIATVWSTILTIVGLKEAHEISGGKATFAVLFPVLTCCGLFILGVVVFMGAIAASFGSSFQRFR